MAERWDGTGRKPRQNDESCPDCNGTGFIVVRDKDGRNFARKCKSCGCEGSRRDVLYRYSGLPRRPRAGIVANRGAIDYADAFPRLKRGRNWMMFIGKPGTGKTTQAVWLVATVIERYQSSARFYNAFDLTRRFVALRKRNDEFEREFERYLDAELVVIDDFLKTIPSAKSYNYADYKETLLELIWARYDARKPIVFTSQRNFRDIAKFDSALAGRIAEACEGRVVSFDANATDWRVQSESA